MADRSRLTNQLNAIRRWRVVFVVALLAIVLLAALSVGAQEFVPQVPQWPEKGQIKSVQRQFGNRPVVDLVIDTDTGVDDAAAIAWLLGQRKFRANVLGITTVAGNTTVDNATNNVLTLLETVGRTDIPVTIGAAEPLSQTLSHTGKLVHGPDGLWFVGWQNPHDLSDLPTDVPAFYRDTALANPGAKLLTLGPLTNLAQAITLYPDEMAMYSEIVILGGAKNGGNSTPVSEFNIWQDPEAAQQVFTSGLPITLVTMDAFSQFTVTMDDVQELADSDNPAGQFVATPLEFYVSVQIEQGGADAASVPDVAAAMVALDDRFVRDSQSSLVKVLSGGPRLARGQTIIGLGLQERISMIADDAELSALADQAFSDPDFDLEAALAAILAREPDNAISVLDVRERWMRALFMRGLTR